MNHLKQMDEISYVKSFERVRSSLGPTELVSTLEVLRDAEALRTKWIGGFFRNLGKRQAQPMVFQLPAFIRG